MASTVIRTENAAKVVGMFARGAPKLSGEGSDLERFVRFIAAVETRWDARPRYAPDDAFKVLVRKMWAVSTPCWLPLLARDLPGLMCFSTLVELEAAETRLIENTDMWAQFRECGIHVGDCYRDFVFVYSSYARDVPPAKETGLGNELRSGAVSVATWLKRRGFGPALDVLRDRRTPGASGVVTPRAVQEAAAVASLEAGVRVVAAMTGERKHALAGVRSAFALCDVNAVKANGLAEFSITLEQVKAISSRTSGVGSSAALFNPSGNVLAPSVAQQKALVLGVPGGKELWAATPPVVQKGSQRMQAASHVVARARRAAAMDVEDNHRGAAAASSDTALRTLFDADASRRSACVRVMRPFRAIGIGVPQMGDAALLGEGEMVMTSDTGDVRTETLLDAPFQRSTGSKPLLTMEAVERWIKSRCDRIDLLVLHAIETEISVLQNGSTRPPPLTRVHSLVLYWSGTTKSNMTLFNKLAQTASYEWAAQASSAVAMVYAFKTLPEYLSSRSSCVHPSLSSHSSAAVLSLSLSLSLIHHVFPPPSRSTVQRLRTFVPRRQLRSTRQGDGEES